ncbi:hypothetical protein Tco_0441872, partial [Tanacetum coccineum]
MGTAVKSTYASSALLSNQWERGTLTDVKDAFAIIFREESHRGIASSFGYVSKPQVSSFVSKNNNWSSNGNKRCFDLIGYSHAYNKNHGLKQNGFKTFNANSASTSSENGQYSRVLLYLPNPAPLLRLLLLDLLLCHACDDLC